MEITDKTKRYIGSHIKADNYEVLDELFSELEWKLTALIDAFQKNLIKKSKDMGVSDDLVDDISLEIGAVRETFVEALGELPTWVLEEV